MDPVPFRKRSDSRLSPGGWLPGGFISFAAGLCTGVAACFVFPQFPRTAEWMALFALLLMVHFGISEILTAWMRRNRWNVSPLFNAPLKSLSLQDFWGRRWNLAFVEMDKILFLPWLKQRFKTPVAVFGIFLISGLLHEAAVSYPVGRGWGLPTLYFALHGFLVLIEAIFLSVKNWPTPIARLWTWVWILAPLPLLFHAAFRETFLGGLLEFSRSLY
jgi:alginate O-acetyltransferase complex protein AlgI